MPHASAEVGLAEFFGSAAGLRIAFEIFAYSCAAGLFVVPIFAAVQTWSGEDRRARVIGAVNTLNSIYMVGGSIAVDADPEADRHRRIDGARGARRRKYSRRDLFLPPPARKFSRLRIASGLARIVPPRGRGAREPAASTASATSSRSTTSPSSTRRSSSRCWTTPPIFAVDHGIANRWWMQPFLKLADARPLDPSKPLAARALIHEVRQGRRLVIFPEGRITVTGSLMKIYDGAAMIAEKSERARHARAARRARANAILAAWPGADRTALVSQDRGDLPAAARDPGRPGLARPRAPPRGRRRALRHHVRSAVPDHGLQPAPCIEAFERGLPPAASEPPRGGAGSDQPAN